MANYQVHRATDTIAPPDGNIQVPQAILKAPPGSQLVSFTLTKYNPLYDDSDGDSQIGICIGGTDKPPVRLVRGMSWSTTLNVTTGVQIPEVGGLFLVDMVGTGQTSITGFEFYLEFAPKPGAS